MNCKLKWKFIINLPWGAFVTIKITCIITIWISKQSFFSSLFVKYSQLSCSLQVSKHLLLFVDAKQRAPPWNELSTHNIHKIRPCNNQVYKTSHHLFVNCGINFCPSSIFSKSTPRNNGIFYRCTLIHPKSSSFEFNISTFIWISWLIIFVIDNWKRMCFDSCTA